MKETLHISQWNEKKTSHINRWKNLLAASAIALTLASCNTTSSGEKIARDKEKIEIVSNQLSYLIEARKDLVRKYNILLERSKREPENIALEKSKSQVFDAIKQYNRDIEKLGKRHINATKRLDKDILKSKDGKINPDQPIDEWTYDYLLDITN